MKLLPPFIISARLAPAIQIDKTTLSFDSQGFVLDFPDGSEYRIRDFRPGGGIAGETPGDRLQSWFAAILGFLSACAESRQYARARKGDPMKGENSDLFPESIGQWAEEHKSALEILWLITDENHGLLQDYNRQGQ